jgi:hypothetical protein
LLRGKTIPLKVVALLVLLSTVGCDTPPEGCDSPPELLFLQEYLPECHSVLERLQKIEKSHASLVQNCAEDDPAYRFRERLQDEIEKDGSALVNAAELAKAKWEHLASDVDQATISSTFADVLAKAELVQSKIASYEKLSLPAPEWPAEFGRREYAGDRAVLDRAFAEHAGGKRWGRETRYAVVQAAKRMKDVLGARIKDIPPNDWVKAKAFIDDEVSCRLVAP